MAVEGGWEMEGLKLFLEGVKFFNEEKFELAEKNFLESLDLAPQRLSVISNLIKK